MQASQPIMDHWDPVWWGDVLRTHATDTKSMFSLLPATTIAHIGKYCGASLSPASQVTVLRNIDDKMAYLTSAPRREAITEEQKILGHWAWSVRGAVMNQRAEDLLYATSRFYQYHTTGWWFQYLLGALCDYHVSRAFSAGAGSRILMARADYHTSCIHAVLMRHAWFHRDEGDFPSEVLTVSDSVSSWGHFTHLAQIWFDSASLVPRMTLTILQSGAWRRVTTGAPASLLRALITSLAKNRPTTVDIIDAVYQTPNTALVCLVEALRNFDLHGMDADAKRAHSQNLLRVCRRGINAQVPDDWTTLSDAVVSCVPSIDDEALLHEWTDWLSQLAPLFYQELTRRDHMFVDFARVIASIYKNCIVTRLSAANILMGAKVLCEAVNMVPDCEKPTMRATAAILLDALCEDVQKMEAQLNMGA